MGRAGQRNRRPYTVPYGARVERPRPKHPPRGEAEVALWDDIVTGIRLLRFWLKSSGPTPMSGVGPLVPLGTAQGVGTCGAGHPPGMVSITAWLPCAN